jgi:ubiquinone/menaquinone biosynthesis C-methylase UbiE
MRSRASDLAHDSSRMKTRMPWRPVGAPVRRDQSSSDSRAAVASGVVTEQPPYALGSDEAEIARLDAQAAMSAPATRLLLEAGGRISPGMRVLDLGTGLGHVALDVADLVGQEGTVVGIDQSTRLLEIAAQRRLAAGINNVAFVEADVRTFQDAEPFDAIVGRLILFHLPDAIDVLAHHMAALRPGGVVLAIDFDGGSIRAEPPVQLVTTIRDWVEEAFRSAGANPVIGARLALLLRRAGAVDVTTFGVQTYLPPDDPKGPGWVAGLVRSLEPRIIGAAIATEADLDVDTLQQRVAQALIASDAVLLAPTLVGAWGEAPSGP